MTDKTQLRSYFDGTGFDRWAAIYGDAEVSRIRQTVREGHERMLEQAAAWLMESHQSGTILDAGCGTGLFSIEMARRGFDVTAMDIAPRMVEAAENNAQAAGVDHCIQFIEGDAEQIEGRFDAVVCFDVLVHYSQDAFVDLCTTLANRSNGPLLFTYAPYNRLLALMHWVGGHFPQQNRRTTIQMTPDHVVEETLAAAGMRIRRTTHISHGFYHVKLLEANREP